MRIDSRAGCAGRAIIRCSDRSGGAEARLGQPEHPLSSLTRSLFHVSAGAELACASATSRCRDVCTFAAADARMAIVGLDRRHDRFGRPGAG
jgi:hypothetical protein